MDERKAVFSVDAGLWRDGLGAEIAGTDFEVARIFHLSLCVPASHICCYHNNKQ